MIEQELTKNTTGMVSSVGEAGLNVLASNDRVRATYQYEPISELYELVDMLDAVEGTRQHEGRTRGVFRSVIEQAVLEEAVEADDPVLDHIETAFPLEGITSTDLWLVGFAQNSENRTAYHPISQIVTETEASRERMRPITVMELFDRVHDNFSLQTTIHDDQIDDLHRLWGRTFGWTREGVLELQNTLREQSEGDPIDRQTWFSGIADRTTGGLVGACTAERLQLKERDGNVIDLIESTEWDVQENYRGHGVNAASIAFLNAQIYSDLDANYVSFPTIFAECNFGSRSDMSAHKAGFSIPDRSMFGRRINQTNIQNVVVNDGILPEDVYRDFTINVVRNVDRLRMYPILPIHRLVTGVRQLERAA